MPRATGRGAVGSSSRAAGAADRVVVVLNGHFLHSDRRRPGCCRSMRPDAAGPGRCCPGLGLPLSMLAPVAGARIPAARCWSLGDGGRSRRGGAITWPRASALGDLPQGVTGFTGEAAATVVVRLDRADPPRPEAGRCRRAAERHRRRSAICRRDYVFLPTAERRARPGDRRRCRCPTPIRRPRRMFWDATRRADTVAAYDAYLRRYPERPACRRGQGADRRDPDRAEPPGAAGRGRAER